MGWIVLKGLSTIAYFFIFIGGLVSSLVIIYLFFYFSTGIISAYIYYDARSNVESITSIISAMSSFSGDFSLIYLMPQLKCDLEISSDDVRLKTYQVVIEREGSKVDIKRGQDITYPFVKVQGITVEPFKTECSTEEEKPIFIKKSGDKITIGEWST